MYTFALWYKVWYDLMTHLSDKLTRKLVENLGAGRHGDGNGLYLVVDGLDPLTFRSPNSFMRPFARMPRGFFHPVRSVAVLDYRTR